MDIVSCNQIQIIYMCAAIKIYALLSLTHSLASSRKISFVIETIYENTIGTFNITLSVFK